MHLYVASFGQLLILFSCKYRSEQCVSLLVRVFVHESFEVLNSDIQPLQQHAGVLLYFFFFWDGLNRDIIRLIQNYSKHKARVCEFRNKEYTRQEGTKKHHYKAEKILYLKICLAFVPVDNFNSCHTFLLGGFYTA